MTKCIGHRIQGGLQANCPVRTTCQIHRDGIGDASPLANFREPHGLITQAGCPKYKKITRAQMDADFTEMKRRWAR